MCCEVAPASLPYQWSGWWRQAAPHMWQTAARTQLLSGRKAFRTLQEKGEAAVQQVMMSVVPICHKL